VGPSLFDYVIQRFRNRSALRPMHWNQRCQLGATVLADLAVQRKNPANIPFLSADRGIEGEIVELSSPWILICSSRLLNPRLCDGF